MEDELVRTGERGSQDDEGNEKDRERGKGRGNSAGVMLREEVRKWLLHGQRQESGAEGVNRDC